MAHKHILTTLAASTLLLSACGGAAPAEDHRVRSPTPRDRYSAAERIRAERERMEALVATTTTRSTTLDAPEDEGEAPGAFDLESDRYAPPGQCEQTCGLASDLCHSSEEICDIAGHYPQERDFQDTCTWAINTCASARDRCTQCEQAASAQR